VQTLGLTSADLAAYVAAWSHSYVMDVQVRILTLSGDLVTTIAPALDSGQVNLDTTADVTRSATLAWLDPTGALQFEPDSPADGAVYFDNMAQVRVRMFVPALGRVVTCPVFTGPLVKFDRTGDEVSVECQGKEALAMHGVPTMTLRKGHNAVAAIRTIMSERAGEDTFGLPSGVTRRLPKDVHVGWEDEVQPWAVCKSIASSLDMQLYYDGAGVLRLRDYPSAPVYTFKDGQGGNITAPLTVSHDKSNIINQVVVIGHKPADHTAHATLPSWHPASPKSLARNGVWTYLRQTITDDKIGSKKAAQARADRDLARVTNLSFGSTFNALPVPFLDELDMVRISTTAYASTERLRQFSFPLTGGDMTVGYTDAVSIPKTYKRRP